jgi:hypothetical protein
MKGVAGIALAFVVLELVVAPRYGWHRDELYFREAGKHLAWGYVDQPPFVPFVARIADVLAPGNLVVLRFLPAVSVSATVILSALIARELGGRRGAQIGAAAVVASGGFLLGDAHLLGTPAFDVTAWMAILWLTARLLRTGETRLWVHIGAVAGVSLLNKNLLVLLGIALLAGLIGGGRVDVLRSRWLFAGAVLALAIASPHLLWQAKHGWPQLEMARVLADRVGPENRVTMLPEQLLLVGPLYALVLCRGALLLAKDTVLRPLAYSWPAGITTALILGGRPYYVMPLTIVVVIAGVVSAERAGRIRTLPALIIPSALIAALVALPVLPIDAARRISAVNESAAETVGWPELVDEVAGVVDHLPEHERASVVILTGSYGEAGAIDRFGPSHGLPLAYSPHNGYAYFRSPPDDDATVVTVRLTPHDIGQYFDTCDRAGTIDNHRNVNNEAQGEPILVCRGLRGTWSTVWKQLTFLS